MEATQTTKIKLHPATLTDWITRVLRLLQKLVETTKDQTQPIQPESNLNIKALLGNINNNSKVRIHSKGISQESLDKSHSDINQPRDKILAHKLLNTSYRLKSLA